MVRKDVYGVYFIFKSPVSADDLVMVGKHTQAREYHEVCRRGDRMNLWEWHERRRRHGWRALMETTMQMHELKNTIEIRAIPASVADAGKVRLGGEGPSFAPVRAAPAITADNG